MKVSSGNIFADLGLDDAEELQLKANLAIALNEIISARFSNQKEVSVSLGIPQSNVSNLVNYKLQGFSSERLMSFITKLGHSVSIEVSQTPSDTPAISVTRPQVVQEIPHVARFFDAGFVWLAQSCATENLGGSPHPRRRATDFERGDLISYSLNNSGVESKGLRTQVSTFVPVSGRC